MPQVLLLVVPGSDKCTPIDAEGHMALGVMCAFTPLTLAPSL